MSSLARTVPRFSRSFHSSRATRNPYKDVVILATARTPIGSFQGSLSSFSAPQLGALATAEAVKRSGLSVNDCGDFIFGNVVGSGQGQAPATQVAHLAGFPDSIPSTTVNKVCSSGMKTVMYGAQEIALGQYGAVVAGGMESMSNIPFYLPKARGGYGLGHGELVDGLLRDGLLDARDGSHMGMAAEHCAKEMEFSRQDQDAYALETYRRAQLATKSGWFRGEIVPVSVKGKTGTVTVTDDEEPAKLKADKLPTLRPAFIKDGTVTAANASKLNDGACALVLASAQYAQERGLKPIARILGFADAQRKPIEFTIAPSLAIPRAIANAGLTAADVDYYEINEAFSVVSLANAKLLNLNPERLNAFGGAVALGHPIGMSGARIISTLLTVLKHNNKSIGCAAICNGGGGASAIVVERLN